MVKRIYTNVGLKDRVLLL